MSDNTAVGSARWSRRPATTAAAAEWQARDARRWLQLALAAIWLLDGVLQFQPYMFTKNFGTQLLAVTAQGNPQVIAQPITWVAGIVTHHPVPTNAAFAAIQVLLGLGIAWRPTLKPALAASIAWSLGVWWFGEGLGGVLTGTTNPVMGAPGAVILYALLAVLLWPTARTDHDVAPSRFVAERPLGATAARVLWLVLWGSLAYFAIQGSNRSPQGLHDMIAQMASGEPSWLASIETHAANLVAHQGLPVSIALTVLLTVVAVGVFLPRPAARVAVMLALALALVIWVVGEALGGIFTGQGTDPNSGPLLALLALAYWPSTLQQSAATSGEGTANS
ncbi:hypothetical protein NGB36_10720 [Streptomyces sp. RB6PN25]|uniref:Integral membrane protein n=1 Tax=Streptomyces humicola TaxID=2953240 RepID=A0ABT1PTR3_9ACTN|nr:hypothetical protein [Streptomyces humicola]MCQ4081061.1 hypothetical protein [Streptomyces humicola]